MPLQATSGAASYDAFGGGAVAINYIEDVFSTWLYTGNGSTQTITNGIDLSTNGGLVWIKSRSNAYDHKLTDTVRGVTKAVISNSSAAQTTDTNGVTAFNTTGFSLGTDAQYNGGSSVTYASWTFRKQSKFFNVVTYTGDGNISSQLITHNLGSTPGFILCKATSTTGNWAVYHRGDGTTNYTNFSLNTTNGASYAGGLGAVNSTTFNAALIADTGGVAANANGVTYVAYVFAHNAGGFGLTGTDNVISCGTFTTDGSGNATVNLGYEVQWVTVKRTDSTSSWFMMDNMRGMAVNGTGSLLLANAADAQSGNPRVYPTATGFTTVSGLLVAEATYIYIAIRRGPMKVPTDATKVFSPATYTGNGGTTSTGTVLTDLFINKNRNAPSGDVNNNVVDRLRGGAQVLFTQLADAEYSTFGDTFDQMTGVSVGSGSGNRNGDSYIGWNFRRAPSFFDEVCYTGNGTANTAVPHNLNAIPELIITKVRSSNATSWWSYHFALGQNVTIPLDLSSLPTTSSGYWGTTSLSSTNFYVGTGVNNLNSNTLVAYLFATCPGVSKVGNYTGTGTLTTINCGFTGGASFVLIRRTDATANWFIWDTARGMVAGTDPSLTTNTQTAESNANSVYTITTGFQLLASPSADVNTNGGTYIFLAIA